VSVSSQQIIQGEYNITRSISIIRAARPERSGEFRFAHTQPSEIEEVRRKAAFAAKTPALPAPIVRNLRLKTQLRAISQNYPP